MPTDAPKVVVVGAGFAGLAAARALQASNRVQVVVLEASDRAGGRAWTLPVALPQGNGRLEVELGATWLHGLHYGTPQTPNPIYAEALAHGVMQGMPKSAEWWDSLWLQQGAAEPLGPEDVLVAHKVTKAYAEAVEALEPSMQGTVADHLQGARHQVFSEVGPQHAQLAQQAWRWRELLERAINGSHSSDHISASGLALYDDLEGPFAAIPAGYQRVAEAMAAGLDVRYHQEVLQLEYGPAGVRVVCSGGEAYTAAAAVVTVSLGVLKAKHEALFSPPLPTRMVQAIERLQIGVVDKVFVSLSNEATSASEASGIGAAPAGVRGATQAAGQHEASLEQVATEEGVISYSLLWDGSESNEAAIASAAALNGYDSTAKGALSAVGQDGGVSSAASLPSWVKGVFSVRMGGPEFKLWRQPQQAQQQEQQQQVPFMVFWVTGEEALAMERASDADVLGAMRGIIHAFPPLRDELPPGWDIGTGAAGGAVVRSRWGLDPHFAGSYSYLGVGATPEDVEALLQPVYAGCDGGRGGQGGLLDPGQHAQQPGPAGGVVLLCGEACHAKYIGCAHAAHMTGQEQAEWLLRYLFQGQ
ncbi:hypothetical protein N2152v2_001831 [Parachlorella kessleri]